MVNNNGNRKNSYESFSEDVGNLFSLLLFSALAVIPCSIVFFIIVGFLLNSVDS